VDLPAGAQTGCIRPEPLDSCAAVLRVVDLYCLSMLGVLRTAAPRTCAVAVAVSLAILITRGDTMAALTEPRSRPGAEPAGEPLLHEEFSVGWETRWMRKKLRRFTADNTWDRDAPGDFLRVTSERSAGALWRTLDAPTGPPGLRLSWRWRVDEAVDKAARGRIRDERSREGDDFAARLLIAFDAPHLDKSTSALAYVFGAAVPVGSEFRNPRLRNVATIVLRSGVASRGAWIEEVRDPVADFVRVFGRTPRRLTTVAIVVDTDDTKSTVRSAFDELRIDRVTR